MRDFPQTRGLVLGGLKEPDEKPGNLKRACLKLGKALGNSGHVVVACSAYPTSADAFVLEGLATTNGNRPGRILIHHPLDDRPHRVSGGRIKTQWAELRKRVGLKQPVIKVNSEAVLRSSEDFKDAFFMCQVRALLEDTDAVVAVGGRTNGSAAQLLAIARKTYPVIPYPFLGGAARQEYLRQKVQLQQALDDRLMNKLESPDGTRNIAEIIYKLRRVRGPLRIFLSYPWERAADADYVEALLLRAPNVRVFRDEDELKKGDPISESIRTEIDACDVFLALWCAEYAASPYCHDEMKVAADQDGAQKPERLFIVRIDNTRPVWPMLRQPGTHVFEDLWNDKFDRKGIKEAILDFLAQRGKTAIW